MERNQIGIVYSTGDADLYFDWDNEEEKYMKKRVTALILCIALLSGILTACGKSKADPPVAPTPGVTTPTAAPIITAPVVTQPVITSPLFDTKGGITLTGTGYQAGYTPANLPAGMSGAEIIVDDPAGAVGVNSNFVLKTTAKVSEQEIKEALTLTAGALSEEVEFTIMSINDTEYRIEPTDDLTPNMVYRFTIGDSENPYGSFVFQTETKASVKSLYPADLTVGVPTNTGIEMMFSEAIDPDCVISEYFVITPYVKGEYSLYPDGKTVAYIPEKPLADNSVYEVEVKAGLPGVSGKKLEETVKAKFRTGNDTSYEDKYFEIGFYHREFSVVPGTVPELEYVIYYNDDYKLKMNQAVVDIYRYASASAAIDAMKQFQTVKGDYLYTEEGYQYPVNGLTKVDSFKSEMEQPDISYDDGVISLPKLEEGCYLLEVNVSGSLAGKNFDKKTQIMLQVTDLVTYTESSNGRILFWLNDVKNGTVSDATITVDSFSYQSAWNTEEPVNQAYTRNVVKTDQDGLAFVDLNDENAAFVLVESGNKSAYINVIGSEKENNSRYFCYIYTDREVYFQNDLVNFFGIMAPANRYTRLPEKAWLQVHGSMNRVPVKVEADGHFEGSFPIESMWVMWYYGFTLVDADENVIGSKNIRITDADKPLYTSEVTFDKPYYRIGDTVEVTVSAKFFDGTPAPGVTYDLQIYSGDSNYNTVLEMDADGNGSYQFTPNAAEMKGYSTEPQRIYAEATLIGDDITRSSVAGSVMYFASNVIFEAKRETSFTEISLHHRDFSKLRTAEDLSYDVFPDNSYGAAMDGKVKVRLMKYEYIKVDNGTEYDPISKTTRQSYSYNRVETEEKNYTADVKDGSLQIPHIKTDKDFYGYYQYVIQYTDPDTKVVYEKTSYAVEGETDWFIQKNTGNRYRIEISEGPYDVGEQVRCRLFYGEEEITDVPVLYSLYADEYERAVVIQNGAYDFTFDSKLVPSARIYATVLNGDTVKNVGNLWLEYNFLANNLLSVILTTDKDNYRPGETAEVTVQVYQDVEPVKNAVLLLSAVDEACFALGDQGISLEQFITRNYRSVYRNQRFSAFSEAYYDYALADSTKTDGGAPAAGMNMSKTSDMAMETESAAMDNALTGSRNGGSEEVTIRETFLDNPLFTIVELDENGRASVPFKTPDNITEWRLSAIVAETEMGRRSENPTAGVDGRAFLDSSIITGTKLGTTTTGIITTLPFFVNAEANKNFLEGDDIVASARVYGTKLDLGTSLRYLAELYDEAGTLLTTLEAEGISGETTWFNFGKRSIGAYEVIVKAITGFASDGVKCKFNVIKSGTLMPVRKDLSIADIKSISPALYPITLSFYDTAYQPYVDAVNRLLYTYTNRNDSRAAYYVAALASEKLFGSDGYRTEDLDEIRSAFSGSYGLIPLLEYGEGDLAFSAKVCALAPEILTETKKQSLIEEFTLVLSDKEIADSETLTAALFGLAALGQPVLNDLKFTALRSADFTMTAKLYLMAAFAYLGDFGAAAEIYDTLAASNREETEGEVSFRGATTEETIQNTANALISAALIRKADAVGMYRYLQSHTSLLNLYQLEQSAYIKFFYPLEAAAAGFTWTVGDKTEQVEMKIGEITGLYLNKADFEALKISKVSGNLKVRAAYLGGAEEALREGIPQQNIKISKSVKEEDASRNLYRVTLNYEITTDRNYSSFLLSDYIPTGARYFEGKNENYHDTEGIWRSGGYIYNLTGQSMRGSVYIYRTDTEKLEGLEPVTLTGSVSYLIRGAVKGEFAIDTAVLQDRRNGSYALSESGTLEIGDGAWKIELK